MIEELQGCLAPLIHMDFTGVQHLLDQLDQSTHSDSCKAFFTNLKDKQICQLATQFNGTVTDKRLLKRSYDESLQEITHRCDRFLAELKKTCVDRHINTTMHDILGAIKEDTTEAQMLGREFLDPERFRVEQLKKARESDTFDRHIALLIDESNQTRNRLKARVDKFLQGLTGWLRDMNAKTPGQVFISYAWAAPGSEEEQWLQPLLKGIKEHLERCGIITHLDICNPDSASSTYSFMHDKITESEFILLIGTQSLRHKHLHMVSMLHEELAEIRRRREADAIAGRRSSVIPINLSPNHRLAFPAGYEAYTNIRYWADSDYLLNLQQLLGYMFDVNTNAAYQKKWDDFFSDLTDEFDLTIRRSPQDQLHPTRSVATVPPQLRAKTKAQSYGDMSSHLRILQGEKTVRSVKHFVPRDELNTLADFFSSETPYAALTGMGGVGKSQLATYYFLHRTIDYAFRVWFYADEDLDQQYREFAVVCGKIEPGENVSIAEIRLRVQAWFNEQPPGLIVFDNVHDPKSLELYIKPDQVTSHILITTRSPLFISEYRIEVGLLKEAEASALVHKVLGDQHEPDAIKQLTQEVDHLALALSQAAYYILRSPTTIADYLTKYRKETQAFLSYEYTTACPEEMHRSAWATFMISLDQLIERHPTSALLLQFLGYLAPDSISDMLLEKVIATYCEAQKEAIFSLRDTITTLHQYALIKYNPEQKTLSIHRIVQAIIREATQAHHAEQLLTQEALIEHSYQSILDLNKMPKPDWEEVKKDQFRAAMLEHQLRLAELDKDRPNNQDPDHPLDQLRFHTLNSITGGYSGQGKFLAAIPYYKRAEEQSKLSDPNRFRIELHRNWGLAYAHAGQLENAIAIFDKITPHLDKQEPHYKAIILSNRALAFTQAAYKRDNDPALLQRARDEQIKVIQLYRETTDYPILDVPGMCHYQEIYSCGALSTCYRLLGNLDKAIELASHELWRIMILFALRAAGHGRFGHAEGHCRSSLIRLGRSFLLNEQIAQAHACLTQAWNMYKDLPEKNPSRKRCENLLREATEKLDQPPLSIDVFSFAEPDQETRERLKTNGFVFNATGFVRLSDQQVILKRASLTEAMLADKQSTRNQLLAFAAVATLVILAKLAITYGQKRFHADTCPVSWLPDDWVTTVTLVAPLAVTGFIQFKSLSQAAHLNRLTPTQFWLPTDPVERTTSLIMGLNGLIASMAPLIAASLVIQLLLEWSAVTHAGLRIGLTTAGLLATAVGYFATTVLPATRQAKQITQTFMDTDYRHILTRDRSRPLAITCASCGPGSLLQAGITYSLTSDFLQLNLDPANHHLVGTLAATITYSACINQMLSEGASAYRWIQKSKHLDISSVFVLAMLVLLVLDAAQYGFMLYAAATMMQPALSTAGKMLTGFGALSSSFMRYQFNHEIGATPNRIAHYTWQSNHK